MPGRTRTAEFRATINSKREKPQWIKQRREANGHSDSQRSNNKLAIDPQYGEFMRVSKQCANRIRDSFDKLERFTNLAKKRTVFDDGEMNRLIADIRADISESKNQLDHLQSRYATKQARHSENIVNTLQQRLANETSNFKSTLEMRSRSVQQQTARHELYAGPPSASSSSHSIATNQQHHHHNHHSAMMPTYNNSYANSNQGPVAIDMGAGFQSSPPPMFQQQQQQQQQLLLNDQIDMSERADRMHLIESTIVELSTVFNQLADMVQSQGETITRIDMNISETTGNVEAAHDALLRYFASINSNRWLILKVFGVLFFFFVVFVMFAT